ASQASQVARTANRFYLDVPGDLVLLVIDPGRLRAELRYEDVPGAELPFPHIYGPLNIDAVIDARPFAAGPDGTFAFAGGAGRARRPAAGARGRRWARQSRNSPPGGRPSVHGREPPASRACKPRCRGGVAGDPPQTPSTAVSFPDLMAATNSW